MVTTSGTDASGGVQVHFGEGVAVPLGEAVRRLQCLPLVERNVLALRLGLVGRPRSVAQTASLLGLTPERVRRIESLAGARLRHPSFPDEPLPGLGADGRSDMGPWALVGRPGRRHGGRWR